MLGFSQSPQMVKTLNTQVLSFQDSSFRKSKTWQHMIYTLSAQNTTRRASWLELGTWGDFWKPFDCEALART